MVLILMMIWIDSVAAAAADDVLVVVAVVAGGAFAVAVAYIASLISVDLADSVMREPYHPVGFVKSFDRVTDAHDAKYTSDYSHESILNRDCRQIGLERDLEVCGRQLFDIVDRSWLVDLLKRALKWGAMFCFPIVRLELGSRVVESHFALWQQLLVRGWIQLEM